MNTCRCCTAELPALNLRKAHEQFCPACGGPGTTRVMCRVCDGLAQQRYQAASDKRQTDLFRGSP